MARPPENMDELIRSVRDTQSEGVNLVYSTVATVHMQDLSTTGRVAATAYQTHALVAGLGVGNMAPGGQLPMRGQTDIWYRDMDHDGNFSILVQNVVNIARRLR